MSYRLPALVVPTFLILALLAAPAPVAAVVHYGDTAPNFMKTQYNSSPAVTLTVNSYAFKVRVFFLLGHN